MWIGLKWIWQLANEENNWDGWNLLLQYAYSTTLEAIFIETFIISVKGGYMLPLERSSSDTKLAKAWKIRYIIIQSNTIMPKFIPLQQSEMSPLQ